MVAINYNYQPTFRLHRKGLYFILIFKLINLDPSFRNQYRCFAKRNSIYIRSAIKHFRAAFSLDSNKY